MTREGRGREETAALIGLMWELIKSSVVVPVLRMGVYICLVMSLMLFVERLYMGIVIILVKIFWKKPATATAGSPSVTMTPNSASLPSLMSSSKSPCSTNER